MINGSHKKERFPAQSLTNAHFHMPVTAALNDGLKDVSEILKTESYFNKNIEDPAAFAYGNDCKNSCFLYIEDNSKN